MRNRAHRLRTSDSLTISEFVRQGEGWLADGESRMHSQQTTAIRRFVLEKVAWLAEDRGWEQVGTAELREFLAHAANGHRLAAGRWGSAVNSRPVKPRTIETYHGHLKAFCNWLVEEGMLEISLMEAIRPPVVRDDQIQPFTPEQVIALLAAAKRSRHPKRDHAVCMLLLDTGIRVSEFCALSRCNLDLTERELRVLGKGNKERTLPFGIQVKRAILAYFGERGIGTEDLVGSGRFEPLFASERAERFTRSGVRQLIERIGEVAKIDSRRCSPHTFRHTFAVTFLRNGGSEFSLKTLLGHTSLTMTQRYVSFAKADIGAQHRAFSPADNLMRKRTR